MSINKKTTTSSKRWIGFGQDWASYNAAEPVLFRPWVTLPDSGSSHRRPETLLLCTIMAAHEHFWYKRQLKLQSKYEKPCALSHCTDYRKYISFTLALKEESRNAADLRSAYTNTSGEALQYRYLSFLFVTQWNDMDKQNETRFRRFDVIQRIILTVWAALDAVVKIP